MLPFFHVISVTDKFKANLKINHRNQIKGLKITEHHIWQLSYRNLGYALWLGVVQGSMAAGQLARFIVNLVIGKCKTIRITGRFFTSFCCKRRSSILAASYISLLVDKVERGCSSFEKACHDEEGKHQLLDFTLPNCKHLLSFLTKGPR